MKLLRRLFGFRDAQSAEEIEKPSLLTDDQTPLERFKRLSADDRMVQIIVKGDSGNLEYFSLLEYAILHDKDQGVRFAALKRIHLFSEYPRTMAMMQHLQGQRPDRTMEPYLSMALYRLQFIEEEEFNRRINSFK